MRHKMYVAILARTLQELTMHIDNAVDRGSWIGCENYNPNDKIEAVQAAVDKDEHPSIISYLADKLVETITDARQRRDWEPEVKTTEVIGDFTFQTDRLRRFI